MKRSTLVLALSAALFANTPAFAGNSPSENGAVSVVVGSVALSAAPFVIIAGSVVILAESFRAIVTSIDSSVHAQSRTVKAKDDQGREITMHVPEATFAANPVAPGDALEGEKTDAGLLIQAHGRPLVLAPTTPAPRTFEEQAAVKREARPCNAEPSLPRCRWRSP